MYLKYKITTLLLVFSLASFAQKDSGKATPVKDTTHSKSSNLVSIKGKLYIGFGLGESEINIAAYGIDAGGTQSSAQPISQSLVYNCTVDYGFDRYAAIGLGVAYQTLDGIPAYAFNTGYTEKLTRLNTSARLLVEAPFTKHFELYGVFRLGASFWTDNINPSPSSYRPTLGGNYETKPSIGASLGVKILLGPVGIHCEIGPGTPYALEGGLTFRL